MDEGALVFVFVATMFAGVFVIYLALRQQAQMREMQHRERMAMIERGQVPLTDRGPAGRMVSGAAASSRSMSLGIIVIGLGLALMMVIGVAGGSPSIGVGIGGAIAVLGAAFIARSIIVKPGAPGPPPAPPPSDQGPPPLS